MIEYEFEIESVNLNNDDLYYVEGGENKCYYITFGDNKNYHSVEDEMIAEHFGLSVRSYRNILRKFGAKKVDKHSGELYFLSKEEVNKCKEYLNETLIPLLILKGE